MVTEAEIARFEKATLYDLRLVILSSDKENYSKAEILALLDQIASQK